MIEADAANEVLLAKHGRQSSALKPVTAASAVQARNRNAWKSRAKIRTRFSQPMRGIIRPRAREG
jgi:hypothetical protein